jgi:hypothetical protein
MYPTKIKSFHGRKLNTVILHHSVLQIKSDNMNTTQSKRVTVIYGPAGSGKTTLANALAADKRHCKLHNVFDPVSFSPFPRDAEMLIFDGIPAKEKANALSMAKQKQLQFNRRGEWPVMMPMPELIFIFQEFSEAELKQWEPIATIVGL